MIRRFSEGLIEQKNEKEDARNSINTLAIDRAMYSIWRDRSGAQIIRLTVTWGAVVVCYVVVEYAHWLRGMMVVRL